VTDSTADLDPALASELGVDVVPLYVNFGTQSFLDRVEITREEFYRRLAHDGSLPTTSQAPAAAYAELFARRIEEGREVVCLSISAQLSGTINAATAAAAQFPGATIRIFDSRTVSGGLWLLVRAAAAEAQRGGDADGIVRRLEEMRARQALFAAIPDLSHVVRTGRISKTMAMVGGMMKVLPILGLNEEGKVVERARVRTFDRALDALADLTAARLAHTERAHAVVVHARAAESAAKLRERLLQRDAAAKAKIDVFETGPAIAVHAGIGAVGIFSLY